MLIKNTDLVIIIFNSYYTVWSRTLESKRTKYLQIPSTFGRIATRILKRMFQNYLEILYWSAGYSLVGSTCQYLREAAVCAADAKLSMRTQIRERIPARGSPTEWRATLEYAIVPGSWQDAGGVVRQSLSSPPSAAVRHTRQSKAQDVPVDAAASSFGALFLIWLLCSHK